MSIHEERILVHRVDRTIFFFDEVGPDSVLEAIKLLQDIQTENSKKPIEFIINSGGGLCYDGLALYDKLRQSTCEILMVGTGIVGSMALIVFLAGDKRQVTENTTLLNHQMTGGEEGLKVADMKIDYEETKRLDYYMNCIIAERTGQKLSKLEKDVKIGDRWITAEQAVEDGFADGIIPNKRTRRRRKDKGKN